jgi:hypothetical protein
LKGFVVNIAIVAVLLVTSALAAVLAAGCGGQPEPSGSPRGGPDITGIVWTAAIEEKGDGSLLVVGLWGAPGAYDRASVRVTANTRWLDPGGQSISPPATPLAARELVGRRVAATFTGAVAESYPVQATARSVRILEPLGSSMHVTPAGLPQLTGKVTRLVADDDGRLTALVVRPRRQPGRLLTVPITADTAWMLATPTELKTTPWIPLVGNGLESVVDIHLVGDTARWVVVHLPRVDVRD